ncbi:MAG: hypothetical protein ABIH89_06465, partial [Elusimicrobiota bacterium]
YVYLSKGKRELFWNCIKAIAIHRDFPNTIVRFLMKSRFFKKYPKILLFLAHNYIRLFAKYRIRFDKHRIHFEKLIPLSCADTVEYVPQEYIRQTFIVENAEWMFYKPKLETSLFLPDNSSGKKKCCLRIRNEERLRRFIKIIIVIKPFKKEDEYEAGVSLWAAGIPIGAEIQSEMNFSFSEEGIYYSREGEPVKARLLKGRYPGAGHKRLYSVDMKYGVRKKVSMGTVLLEL